MLRRFALASLLGCLGACATAYTPSPDRPFEPIAQEFTSSQRVTLRNVQTKTEPETSGPWKIDYHAWTDVAIQIAKRELEKRGVQIVPDAQKTIDLAVQFATTETGWVKITSTITMTAATGNGHSATYTGVNSSAMAANTKRQIDGALMRVVVQLLSDPLIVEYLTK